MPAALLLVCVGCGVTPPREPLASGTTTAGELERLPLRDGSWASAAALDAETHDATPAERPNTLDEAQDDTDSSPRHEVLGPDTGLSAAGQAGTDDARRTDGLSAAQFYRGGARGSAAGGIHSGSTFAEGAIRSLRSGTPAFSAEASGAGATLAVESRGGEARLHGTIGAWVRNSAWAAANPFAIVSQYLPTGGAYSAAAVQSSVVKPRDTSGEVSASGGGGLHGGRIPSWARDRVQGFAAIEQRWRSNPVISAPASPGFFLLSPTQLALLGTRGVSPRATDAALGYLQSLMGPVGRSSARTLLFLRADAEPSARDHVFVSWTRNRFRSPAGVKFASPSEAVVPRGRASVGDEHLAVDGAVAAWTRLWTPNLSNDLRGQWVGDAESETPRAPLPQEPAVAPGGFSTEVRIAPEGFSYGTPSTLARSAFPDETRTELVDRVQYLRGRTLLTLGGDWSRIEDRVASQPGLEGAFSYDSGTTGGKAGGLVDWITDEVFGVTAYPNAACPAITAAVHRFCFRSYTQSFGTTGVDWFTHTIAAFAQGSTRLGSRVSVTAGVRWEYELLPLPQRPNALLDNSLRAVINAGDRRFGTTASFPEDRNNFGPRMAAAWAAPLGFTMRAGYGLFFGRIPGATIEAALAETGLPSGVERVRITPTTETICPQHPAVSFGLGCAFANAPPSGLQPESSSLVLSAAMRVPAIQRATMTLEHALGPHGELSIGYSGARGTQLPTTVDLNLAQPTTSASFVLAGGTGRPGAQDGERFVVPLYTARLLPQFGRILAVTSSANASYDALVAQGREAWHGVALRASYAFSHADDYGPLQSAEPRGMTQFDPYVDGYDKGRSTLDVTHRLVGSITAESRWTGGSRMERRLFSGWRVGAIGDASSGMPYSYRIFGGTYLPGSSETINGAGGATYLPTAGRNTLRLPMRSALDLRVGRVLSLGTRLRGEAFAEAFNVFNERNLTAVESRAYLVGTTVNGVTPLLFQDSAAIAAEGIATPPFGAPSSSTSGLSRERQIEFGVRLSY